MRLNAKSLRGLILSASIIASPSWAEDITGRWKAMDDKSGSPRAIVNIYQNTEGTYEGKVEEIYALPNRGEPFSEKCFRCKGDLKDRPIVGMKILYNFTRDGKNLNEYTNGQVIDPISGNIYKGKIKMNPNGKRITLREGVNNSV